MVLSCSCVLAWALAANAVAAGNLALPPAAVTALVLSASVGPVLIAAAFMAASQGFTAVINSFLWKQDGAARVGAASVHFLIGSAVCALPVAIAAQLAL